MTAWYHGGKTLAPGLRGGALLALAVAFPGVLLTGCHTSTNMRLGARAEQHGRYHVAYQYYCDEAKQRSSNGVVQAAITRVAPRAAQHYAQAGTSAADAGNYADAWRLYMRALAITPDDTAVARLIEVLERHQPGEVAPAKAAWEQYGAKALAVAPAPAEPLEEPPSGIDTAAAPRPEPDPPPRRAAPPVPEVESAGWIANLGPAEHRDDILDDSPARAAMQPDEAAVAAEQSDDRQEEPDAPQAADAAATDSAPAAAQPAAEPEMLAPPRDAGYLMTAILSIEDRRFGRRTHTLDDIHVRLKDTDPDPDADLDIYVGTTRVEKARDVEPGEAVRVRGRSGKWYEVIVITIVDRTESVRIGIRPAPGTDG